MNDRAELVGGPFDGTVVEYPGVIHPSSQYCCPVFPEMSLLAPKPGEPPSQIKQAVYRVKADESTGWMPSRKDDGTVIFVFGWIQ
jgi:hypothetical protein